MKYPLFFRFLDEVRTERWTALVEAHGRCLMSFEDDLWWAEGVQPGGVVGTGVLPAGATDNFRAEWAKVLEEIADGSPSLNSFMTQVEAAFQEISEPAAREWEAVRMDIRAGKCPQDGPFARMPQETALRPSMVVVREINPPVIAHDPMSDWDSSQLLRAA